jgi:lipoprotein-releasing system permease protein
LATGTELDEKLAIADLSSVAIFAGARDQISGLALQVADLFDAPQLRRDIARILPPTQYVSDWTSSQGNLYAAIRLSRDIITLLLLSIIAVAAFNVVSSLVLVVTDRRRAIAMLSALGASSRDIQAIFLLQGLVIGVIGAAIGSLAGLSLAFAAPHLAQGLEGLLGVQLLNTDVYPLAFLPVDIRLRDFVIADLAAIVLCVLAAVVPARRAANMPVAEILAS